MSQSMTADVQDDDEEVSDLVNLLNELNAHHDLTVKLSNQSKIVKFLHENSRAEAIGGVGGPGHKKSQT